MIFLKPKVVDKLLHFNLVKKTMDIRKDIKILLCTPPFETLNIRTGESLGIRYIASYIMSQGYRQVDIIEPSLSSMESDFFVSHISRINYDIIGFSIPFDGLAENTFSIIKQIKKKQNCHICVGGHFPTYCYEEILTDIQEIDSIAVGFSERTFFLLVEAISENRSIKHIPNLFTRNSEYQIFCNNSYKIPIDDLPYPIRNQPGDWNSGSLYSIISSRGCPFVCSFCSAPNFSRESNLEFRTVDNVVNEIKMLNQQYSASRISFLDSCFLGTNEESRERALDIAKNIFNYNSQLCWSMECRVNDISQDLFRHLYSYGLRHVFIGIESFIERKLRLFKKGTKSFHNKVAIDILDDLGITFYFGFIMFDPYIEPAEIIMESQGLAENGILTFKSLTGVLMPYKGTELFVKLNSENMLNKDGWHYNIKFVNSRISIILENLKFVFEKLKEFDLKLFKTQYEFQSPNSIGNLNLLRTISKNNSYDLLPFIYEIVNNFNNNKSDFIIRLKKSVDKIIFSNLKKLEVARNTSRQ